MSTTKSIIPETAIFKTNLIHYEEWTKSSPENPPNCTNPGVSNIEEVNEMFTFKEATIQLVKLDYVGTMSKEICDHENDHNWTLVRRRELNGKNTIIYKWYFNIKRAPYGRHIKNKARMCAHVGKKKWGWINRIPNPKWSIWYLSGTYLLWLFSDISTTSQYILFLPTPNLM